MLIKNYKKIRFFLIFLLILISFLGYILLKANNIFIYKSTLTPEKDASIASFECTFPSTESIIKYLSSSEINDRFVGSEGNTLATSYLESLFKELNLVPLLNDSYLNTFQYEHNSGYFEDDNYIESTKNINLSNVVGKINGVDNKKAIIITSHFDSYRTATLDNASGVATSLKIAENLKKFSDNKQLEYDVIFAMTNAEMVGFYGSKNLVNTITTSYTDIYNINIDCVGLKNAPPLGLKNMSKVDKSLYLNTSIKESFIKNKINYEDVYSTEKARRTIEQSLYMGVSDYYSFEEVGIPNIHIAQQGITPFIANPETDTIENIDFYYINDLANALSDFITNFYID